MVSVVLFVGRVCGDVCVRLEGMCDDVVVMCVVVFVLCEEMNV